jgi:hypothetical protein
MHEWVPRIPIPAISFGCIIMLFSTRILLFVLLWILYFTSPQKMKIAFKLDHVLWLLTIIFSLLRFAAFIYLVYSDYSYRMSHGIMVTWSYSVHNGNCIWCWPWWSSLNAIFIFCGEVKYNIQSNTNSKTLVLNNIIIHPNEIAGIGMRGSRDNQKWLLLLDKTSLIHALFVVLWILYFTSPQKMKIAFKLDHHGQHHIQLPLCTL